MRFGRIANCAKYRIDQQFKSLPVFKISIIFEIEDILKIK